MRIILISKLKIIKNLKSNAHWFYMIKFNILHNRFLYYIHSVLYYNSYNCNYNRE